jgi:hypothetical protein
LFGGLLLPCCGGAVCGAPLRVIARAVIDHRSTAATLTRIARSEHLGRRAQSELQQGRRREQRDVMAGGAIDLDEVAAPEILDPRQIRGAA